MGFLAKDRLIFDPADLAESDQIGSYLIGAAGDVLTSTTVGGDEALDVNIVQTVALTVSATDFDIRDLTHVGIQDSVAIGDGTDVLSITGSGQAEVAVTAALPAGTNNIGDVDVLTQPARSHTTDSIAIGDGTDLLAIAADGSIGVTQVGVWNVNLTDDGIPDDSPDSGNPFKIGTRAVSGALAAVSATNDRADMISDLYRRTWVNTAPNVGISTPVVIAVGATEVAIPASPLAGRRKIIVQNDSSNDIYIGGTGLTTGTGIRVAKGVTWSDEIGPNIALYAIAGSAGNNVRVTEIA